MCLWSHKFQWIYDAWINGWLWQYLLFTAASQSKKSLFLQFVESLQQEGSRDKYEASSVQKAIHYVYLD